MIILNRIGHKSCLEGSTNTLDNRRVAKTQNSSKIVVTGPKVMSVLYFFTLRSSNNIFGCVGTDGSLWNYGEITMMSKNNCMLHHLIWKFHAKYHKCNLVFKMYKCQWFAVFPNPKSHSPNMPYLPLIKSTCFSSLLSHARGGWICGAC